VSVNPFAGRATRVIGMQDVAALLTMEGTIDVQRKAFLSQSLGRVTAAPNSWLRLPDQERRRGWLKLLAGHDSSSGALGVKVLARFADNPPGANLGSLVLLFDDDNGFPLAVMDGVLITAMRTGAGAGVATAALAAPDPRNVGLVGTGVVGWHSLQATLLVRPSIDHVNVFSRSAERRESTAARIRAELGVDATPVASVEEATGPADILITATNSPEPVIGLEHLRPGMLVNAMGIRTEISPEAIAHSWVVPDGREEALLDGKFSMAVAAGAVRVDDLGPELGAVVAADEGYHADRISLFDSSGIAIQDLALAQHIFKLAEAESRGTVVDLGLATALV
jgi:alanine dehydrogenase